MQHSQASDGDTDRGAARTAILSAARAVAERDGVDGLTLSKVAVEAGLPRAAVYRQFTRKEDLLMSIVSDDLATLACTMKGIDWPEGGETPETAVVVPMQRPAEVVEPAEAAAEAIDMAKDVSAAMTAPPASERKLARRAELMRVLETKTTVPASADVKEEAPPTEKTAPRADQWLERRLRVFEKGMAAMEARQEQVEKNARAVVATAEASIKALEDKVKELSARADATDDRHKASSNEVRTALNEATLRIQTVEGVAKAALAENKVPDAALDMAPEPFAAPMHDEPVVEQEADAARAAEPSPEARPEEAKVEAPKSKIMEVRASVAAATAAAAVTAEAKREAQLERAKRNRTRYLLAGLIVLIAFIAAGTLAFSKGMADGRYEALHNFSRPVSLGPLLAMPAATPLDQLTARAQAGDAAAEYVVGTRYLHGEGTAKNSSEGLRWLTLAAAKGLPSAQYMLGSLYMTGIGAKADVAKALQWYEAAALQGNRKAMHGLAIAYAQGSGASQNMQEAVRWFSRAAQLGYVDSQFNLAVLYERGDGVPQSLLDAYKWYLVASRNGDSEAKERVATLKTQLNADDLAAATHAAAAFQPAPYNVAANTTP